MRALLRATIRVARTMIPNKSTSAWCIGAALLIMNSDASPAQTARFESAARLHRLLKKPIAGLLVIDNSGMEFRSSKISRRWPYEEIKTYSLAGTQELVVSDYENRHWHEPGEQRFRFTLAQPMPASIAAALAAHVARPVINGVPEIALA